MLIPALGIIVMLLPTVFFGGTGDAPSVRVQFLNGRNGKPIAKGVRIWRISTMKRAGTFSICTLTIKGKFNLMPRAQRLFK